MAEKNTGTAPSAAPAQVVTLESLRADHGDLVATLENSASEAAMKAATQAERDRVSAIMALSRPGRETLIAGMIADGTDAAAASSKILAAIDAGELAATSAGPSAEAVLAKMDRAAEGVVSSVSEAEPAAANDPEGWAAEYTASDKLKAEFPTAESYVAYKKREGRQAA